jgi:hypothetical protein
MISLNDPIHILGVRRFPPTKRGLLGISRSMAATSRVGAGDDLGLDEERWLHARAACTGPGPSWTRVSSGRMDDKMMLGREAKI